MWRRLLWFLILATFARELSADPSVEIADDPALQRQKCEPLGGSEEAS